MTIRAWLATEVCPVKGNNIKKGQPKFVYDTLSDRDYPGRF